MSKNKSQYLRGEYITSVYGTCLYSIGKVEGTCLYSIGQEDGVELCANSQGDVYEIDPTGSHNVQHYGSCVPKQNPSGEASARTWQRWAQHCRETIRSRD